MHAWEGQNFSDVSLLTQRRDPRRFQVGCATSNGEAVVLQWFRNMPEISQWLRRMEPQRWALRGPALIAIKSALEPILTRVDVYGLEEDSRLAHNRITADHYQILWWGDFTTFAAAGDHWSDTFLTREGLTPVDAADNTQAKTLAEALRARLDAKAD
jgi:hypothetical protein